MIEWVNVEMSKTYKDRKDIDRTSKTSNKCKGGKKGKPKGK